MRRLLVSLALFTLACEPTRAPQEEANADAGPLPPPSLDPLTSVPEPKPSSDLVRETAELVVDGKTERWVLEWERAPVYDCFESSCPCENVTYGERGPLRLIRARDGEPKLEVSLGERALQRWAPFEDDASRVLGVTKESIAILEARPLTRLMFFGDYDHDGRATELVLDRGSSPCSAHDAVLIGVDREHATPRIVGTVDAPDAPLVLNGRRQWERIRRAATAELVAGIELLQLGCGNHGSGTESTIVVRLVKGGFRATERRYDCTPEGRRGPLTEEKPWRRDSSP